MSIDPSLLKGRIQDYLTTYLLKYVWNHPYTEFRQNIRLRPISNKKVVSVVLVDNVRVYLPSNHTYYVYDCPVPRPIGVYPHSDTWVSLKDFVNSSGLDLRIHGKYGEFLYRDQIYLKVDRTRIIIAILADMYEDIIPNNLLTEVYLHLYLTQNDSKKINTECYVVGGSLTNSEIYTRLANKTTIYVNGRESVVEAETMPKLNVDDRIEVISDPAVIGVVTIDEGTDDYRTFIDSSDNKEKVIVHIPKAINPNNRLLTHNTCDIFIRPIFPTNVESSTYYTDRLAGAYVSRNDTDKYIAQITHNDFYIDKELIDMYKTHYGFTNISIKVIIRESSKTAYLIDERYGIRVLYSLTDDEILDFLSGDGDFTMTRWTANSLANSDYAKTLYKLQKPDEHSDLTLYLNMFGYLGCANIVCSKVQRYTVKPYTGHTICIPIPMSMYNATEVTCLIRLNGLLVDTTLYTTSTLLNELTITLDNNVELKVGQTLIFELVEKVIPRAEYITPIAGSATISTTGPVSVYKVRTIGSTDTVTTDFINDAYPMTESFELVTTGYTVDTNGLITFDAGSYNNTYLITSRDAFGTAHSSTFSIDSLANNIISTGLIMTTCKTWTTDEDITVPCLWDTFLPYLNGYELASEIDYTVVPIKSNLNHMIGYAIHINSIDYLVESDNLLTVMVSPDREISRLNDFSHEHTNDSIFTTFMWFGSINMMSASGLAVDNVQRSVDRLGIPYEIPAGSLLHTRISLPESLIEVLNEASSSSNHTAITDINYALLMREYLKYRQEKNYKLSVIEKSHNVYSILTTLVIKEVLAGNTPVVNDYLALQMQDVVLHNNFNTITVSRTSYGAGAVNGVYSLHDTGVRGNDRMWINSAGYYIIFKGSYWDLCNSGGLSIYKSRPVSREYDPWLLIWDPQQDNIPIIMQANAIDLRYIDAFPSYRAYDIPATTGYASIYNNLRDVIQTIFPADGIQAGVTMR